MAALFFGMIVVAGVGIAVASSLAAYAQRHWTTSRPQLAAVGARMNTFSRPLGDVAGFGEQLHDAPVRYGYTGAR